MPSDGKTRTLILSLLLEPWHRKALPSLRWPGRNVAFHGDNLHKFPGLKQMNKQVSP